MKRRHQRLAAYASGVAMIVGGGLLAKRSPEAGLSLITSGGYILGALREQALPPQHDRRHTDPKPEPQTKETD